MNGYLICDYFNPCSTKFDSFKIYHKLTCLQRTVIAIATAIIAVISAGIFATPCFRFLVGRCKPASSANLLSNVSLNEQMVKEALPVDVINALGGVREVLKLPVRSYIHIERQEKQSIDEDLNYLSNTSSNADRLWLEVGRSEDANIRASNFPVSSGKPMICVCIRQEIQPYASEEEKKKAFRYTRSDDDDPNSFESATRGLAYLTDDVTSSLDVIFRHCFCKSAAHGNGEYREYPTLQVSHVYNTNIQQRKALLISTVTRPHLFQIQKAYSG